MLLNLKKKKIRDVLLILLLSPTMNSKKSATATILGIRGALILTRQQGITF